MARGALAVKPPELIEVHAHVKWADPATNGDWYSREEIKDAGPALNHSIGWLLPDQGDKYVRLAMTQTDGGLFCDILVIDKALIVKMRKVRVKGG